MDKNTRRLLPTDLISEEDLALAITVAADARARQTSLLSRFLLGMWLGTIGLGFAASALGYAQYVAYTVLSIPFVVVIIMAVISSASLRVVAERLTKLELWERAYTKRVLEAVRVEEKL
jgi:hypothetical protein